MQAGGHVDVDVDLVDVEPVGDQALVARKDHVAEVLEGLQRVAADPAVVLVGQMQRHVEVVERDEGLDALVLAGAEDVLVELKAFLVGLGVVAVGEDAGPVDGHAVHIAAHLGHQVDVALPVAVEVGRDVAGVIGVGVDDRLGALGHVLHRGEGRTRPVRHIADELAGNVVAAVAAGQRVRHSEALAAADVAALILVCSRGAAPQKALRETHSSSLKPCCTCTYSYLLTSIRKTSKPFETHSPGGTLCQLMRRA